MKTFQTLLFTLLTLVFCANPLRAQTPLVPEFSLQLHYTDTTSSGQGFEFPYVRSFGYDARATNSYDLQFAEDGGPTNYPGSVGAYPDLFFLYPGLDSTTRIDIRHKPSEQSFQIDYVMGVKFQYPAGHLFWDPKSIPAGINAIWIRPYTQRDTVLVDMTRDSIFKVSLLQNDLWGYEYLVSLFYNMTPPALSVDDGQKLTELLGKISVYPNPIREHGRVALNLTEPAIVTFTGFDETGRECLRQSVPVSAGSSAIALNDIAQLHGSILLHVEARSATQVQSRNILVVKQ